MIISKHKAFEFIKNKAMPYVAENNIHNTSALADLLVDVYTQGVLDALDKITTEYKNKQTEANKNE